jgi:transposase InsO family protein
MTLHRLFAGAGYQCLVKHTATGDGHRTGSAPLTSHYTRPLTSGEADLRRAAGRGVCHRQTPRPATASGPHQDLVRRDFTAHGPDRLCCTDITDHPTSTAKVYCTAAPDVFTRKLAGCCRLDEW